MLCWVSCRDKGSQWSRGGLRNGNCRRLGEQATSAQIDMMNYYFLESNVGYYNKGLEKIRYTIMPINRS